MEESAKSNVKHTGIHIIPNGPILVNGNVELIDQKGNKTTKTDLFALCRCGTSHNKPFCDGTHNYVGFTDDQQQSK